MRRLVLSCAAVLALVLAAGIVRATTPAEAKSRIGHIFVIYLENRGFDHLYGLFPGADGLRDAGPRSIQRDAQGRAYETLPPVMDTTHKPPAVDPRFPARLPNAPFLIDPHVPQDVKTGDLVHRYYQQIQQIDGGSMSRFAAYSDAGGLVMGYYDGRGMALWQYAQRYVLADRFFQGALGGSFLNHFWLVCACTPRFTDGPAEMRAVLDADGRLVKDGALTPDGYAVNTIQPRATPHHPAAADPAKRLPPQDLPTIGDRLSERGVSWAWYSGGWDDALAGKPDPRFQFHHQPFAYFQRYGDGTPDRAKHLKDLKDLLADIEQNTLPQVVFYKPIGADNQHPGYADVAQADRHVADLLGRLEKSPAWPGLVVIVTYDENGGFWDHVPPPVADRWGPGTRVPTLVISPLARRGYVDHTPYDTTSILRFIEWRHDLAPLGERDAKAHNLLGALAVEGP
jgi:phospholipase C